MELKNITLHDITHTGMIKDYSLSADIDHWGINLEDPESKIPTEIVPATIWYEQCESWDVNQWMVVMWMCPKTRIQRMTALISDGHCYIYTVRIL